MEKVDMREVAQQQVDTIRKLIEGSELEETFGDMADKMQEYLDVTAPRKTIEFTGISWSETFDTGKVYVDSEGDEWAFSQERNAWYNGDIEEREYFSADSNNRGYPNCPGQEYSPYTEVRDA